MQPNGYLAGDREKIFHVFKKYTLNQYFLPLWRQYAGSLPLNEWRGSFALILAPPIDVGHIGLAAGDEFCVLGAIDGNSASVAAFCVYRFCLDIGLFPREHENKSKQGAVRGRHQDC
jgi:hypothetical protein